MLRQEQNTTAQRYNGGSPPITNHLTTPSPPAPSSTHQIWSGPTLPKTAAEPTTVLRAHNVEKYFQDGNRVLEVLRGVTMDINAAEFVSIVGQSGSGKSTLLHLLGALDRPTNGTISLNGEDLSKLSEGALSKIRSKHVGFIFQFHHLLPEFTALENVLLPGMIAGRPQSELLSRAREVLNRVGLAERTHHRPSKLSGGEQQRVALARALFNDPTVLLADEPTGDLDKKTGQQVLEYMIEATRGVGKSLVMVTHDPEIAARADRQFRLTEGRLDES